MKFLSICSGIEAASVAWRPLGWEAAGFSEIDPFASHVLQHHYGSGQPWFMPDPDAVPAPDMTSEGSIAAHAAAVDARRLALKAVAGLPRTPFNAASVPALGDHRPVPNFGDMTRFKDWPDVPALDVLCGGTPCQSFSVAGLRKGLADPRGNLTLTFLGIAQRYRPRWVVWENVPGVLSADGGRAFGAFLGGLAELGYGWAYRVLDAQYVRVDGFERAVPQRRRRVFVVGHLGHARRAAAVLFERASLCGDPPPRREARKVFAPAAARSLAGDRAELAVDGALAGGARGSGVGGGDVARSLTASDGGVSGKEQATTFVIADAPAVAGTLGGAGQSGGFRTTDLDNSGAFIPGFWDGGQVASTLDASGGAKRQTMPDKDRFMAALVPGAAYAFQQRIARNGRGDDGDVVSALTAQAGGTGKGDSAPCVAQTVPWEPLPPVADPITANEGSTYTHEGSRNFRLHKVVGQAVDSVAEISPTLRGGANGAGVNENGGVMPAVAFKASHYTRGKDGAPSDVHPPLTADADKGDQDPVVLAPAPVRLLVRRLMPVECELLMGFPRGYTLVPFRGTLAADGPRYRALGNSWAVNCPRWIGRRIMAVEGIVDA